MKQILFTVLVLLTFRLHAADYYWVGSGGNRSDLWHLDGTGKVSQSGMHSVQLQGLVQGQYLFQSK